MYQCVNVALYQRFSNLFGSRHPYKYFFDPRHPYTLYAYFSLPGVLYMAYFTITFSTIMYNSRLCNYFDTILMRDNTRFGWNWLKITLYLKFKMILNICFRCVHVNSKYYQNMSRHPWNVTMAPTLRTPGIVYMSLNINELNTEDPDLNKWYNFSEVHPFGGQFVWNMYCTVLTVLYY